MSDRMTSVGPRKDFNRTQSNILIQGFAVYGREDRPTMIEQFRKHYQQKLEEAQTALALTDDQLVVHTYVGVWAMNNCKEVTE